MEYYTYEHECLEEILGLREMEYYHTNQLDFNTISGLGIDSFSNTNCGISPNTWFEDSISTILPIDDQNLNSCSFYAPNNRDKFSTPEFTPDSSFDKLCFPSFLDDYYSLSIENEDGSLFGHGLQNSDIGAPCTVEPLPDVGTFNVGYSFSTEGYERKSKKAKKLSGQPSKNLMAERRRRKRLNDRLLMLRSVVPKISKMDRTSILGDTIDYMNELLVRINNLQEEMDVGSNVMGLMSIFKDVKPSEILVRNSPKFDVERRTADTKIEICCAEKPGLLLSTVATLEGLGLEIQQCVISCFNDFAMQASCSDKELKQRAVLDTEDVKHALLRNAGYGGKCL